LSIIAAFGALHLANDHTYKASDKPLLRKGKAYVAACRTALLADEHEKLADDSTLEVTIRTCSHPFGLASTWGAFKSGRSLKIIAEPLQIRDDVVPPPIAKVGLVVSQLGKMFSLPIGHLFKQAYGEMHEDLLKLKKEIVDRAAEYSALHKHYGYDKQLILTADQEARVDNLLPIASAYALVFDVNAQNEASGAALSQIVQKCRLNNGGLVDLYMNAFAAYINSATNLGALIEKAVKKTKAITE
jgi:hypothetical protein